MDEEATEQNTEKLFIYHYPSQYRGANGHLHMATSMYMGARHASGGMIIGPDHPDYELWLWIVSRLASIERGCISDEDREEYRPAFEQERQQAASPILFRERLLAAIPICPEPTTGERVTEAISSLLEPIAWFVFMGVMVVVSAVTAPLRWWERFSQRSCRKI